MAAPISSEIHNLIVNPRNTSLVLGAADYLTHRPAQWLLQKATKNPTKTIPSALSPAKWGEQASRLGEKADYAVGSWLGHARKEDVKLEPDHIKRIKSTLDEYSGSADENLRQHGEKLRASLDNLIREHSHSSLDLSKVLEEHGRNDQYALTLHGVSLPSVGGEFGKKVKRFGTDAATLVGSGAIMNEIYRAQGLQSQQPQEGAQNMDPKIARIQDALSSLEKAAAILADIPKRDEALKKANDLCAAGAIAVDEIDKYAAVFYGSPEASDVLAQTVHRIAPAHAKSARLGEVISDISSAEDRSNGGRGSSFDDFCLSQFNR